jgi:succinyl-diaminopimelate desuccinylase
MKDEVLPLAKKLLTVPSMSGDIEKSIEVLELAKRELSDYSFTPYVSNTLPSLLYTNKPDETKNFKIILNAHLDVVPAPGDQFKPTEKDGKLYARGAYDTKAAAAAMIIIFKELGEKLNYPLGLQLTTDEELGGMDGTAYQIQQGVRGEFMIASECGSNFNIAHEAKARLVIKLISKGKTSHTAYPWRGNNAIWNVQQTLHAFLHAYPIPKEPEYRTTITITNIKTGGVEEQETAYNRVPDYCEALIDVRYVPTDKEKIIEHLTSLLTQDVELKVLHNTTPHQTDANNKYVQSLKKHTEEIIGKEIKLIQQHATSDARHYTGVGTDGVEFGPIGENQHTENECVDLHALTQYYEILKKFLLSYND